MYATAGMRTSSSELIFLIAEGSTALLLWFWIARASRRRPVRPWLLAAAVFLLAVGRAASHRSMLGLYGFTAFRILLVFPSSMFILDCAFVGYSLYELRRRTW
jgi:hypothetical protein